MLKTKMNRWLLTFTGILAIMALIGMPTTSSACPPPGHYAAGHLHMTSVGGHREALKEFVEQRLEAPFKIEHTGSGDLRRYLREAIRDREIERGVLMSYTHLEVHQLFEKARPLIAELPERYPVRPELAPLSDPKGEIHVMFADSFVIVYNRDKIATADVPQSWRKLAAFDQPIGVPTTGCDGTWGTMALFYQLGEDCFTKLIANAEVRGSSSAVVTAVMEGRVAVGVATLLSYNLRDAKVGVVWPEEGAIARPGMVVLPNDPAEGLFRLADLLMDERTACFIYREFNLTSARVGGPAPSIVWQNDFHFSFIPTEAIVAPERVERVGRIIR